MSKRPKDATQRRRTERWKNALVL